MSTQATEALMKGKDKGGKKTMGGDKKKGGGKKGC